MTSRAGTGTSTNGNFRLLTESAQAAHGFSPGFVVGDWNSTGKYLAARSPIARPPHAGLDLYMAPATAGRGCSTDTCWPMRGETVSAAQRLDDAVRRVLGQGQARPARAIPRSRGATSRKSGCRRPPRAGARGGGESRWCCFKNEGEVLPLKPGARARHRPGRRRHGDAGRRLDDHLAGHRHTPADYPNGHLRSAGRSPRPSLRRAARRARPFGRAGGHGADVAVVVYGERPTPSSRATAPITAFRASPAEEALLERLTARGLKVVSVFLTGRPLFAGEQINRVGRFRRGLAARHARARCRRRAGGRRRRQAPRDYTGTLPFAWPADARAPIAEPLFPVGYGLGYPDRPASGRSTKIRASTSPRAAATGATSRSGGPSSRGGWASTPRWRESRGRSRRAGERAPVRADRARLDHDRRPAGRPSRGNATRASSSGSSCASMRWAKGPSAWQSTGPRSTSAG